MTTSSAAGTIAQKARNGLPIDHLFVMDSHAHIGSISQFHMPRANIETIIEEMDRMGIDKVCISGNASAMGADFVAGNNATADAMRRFPDRVVGYVGMNPNLPGGMKEEVERCAAMGFSAIKVHSILREDYTDAAWRPAFEEAEARNWPVLAHTWGKRDCERFEKIAADFPSVTFILAHAGIGDVNAYITVGQNDNIFLDTCFSGCPMRLVERLVAGVGAEKVLWGSDTHFLNPAQQFGKVAFADLTETEKEAILGGNARKIFGIEN